ncbi:MAG: alkyl hydroperoxide reductase [Thiothrix lacustris]|uniref:Alkyl hydroperoxide reductase n=1 Tax=Thiothrix lacustris TaxID=525917 RepID=A0A1Y1QT23_9GAMM|nr:MAG: alkyl hydroperoxide reductase [Thiothrix lacustris]
MTLSNYSWINGVCLALMLFTAPTSAMQDMDGNSVDLTTSVGKGKWSVVEIWASDCRICQLSIQHIVNFKATHPDVNIIGVSVDGAAGKADAQTFIDEQHLTFPNLLSDKQEIDHYLFTTAEKNFIGTPTFLFYDPQGKLLTVQAKALTEKELSGFMDSQGTQVDIAEPC